MTYRDMEVLELAARRHIAELRRFIHDVSNAMDDDPSDCYGSQMRIILRINRQIAEIEAALERMRELYLTPTKIT